MITEPGNAGEAVAARQAQIGASWFTWIAGLTLVNVVTALFGSEWMFMLSLMAPVGVAGEAHKTHEAAWYVATTILTLLGIGLFFLLGHFGKKGARWAFFTGLFFYGIDTLVWLGMREWVEMALHGYALWRIGSGLGAANRLAALRRQNMPPAWAPPQGQYANAPDSQQWPPAPVQTPLSAPPSAPAFAENAPASPALETEMQAQEPSGLSSEIGHLDTHIDVPDTNIDVPSTHIDSPDDHLGLAEE